MAAPVAPAQAQPVAAADPVSQYTFGSNRVKLLNVDPWGSLGWGCIDPGDQCCFSQNMTLRTLVHEIGQCQLMVMMNPAARGWQPPPADVAKRVAAMYNRATSLLAAEMIAIGDTTQSAAETSKADQSSEAFLLHPVPYFAGPMTGNKWLDQLNRQTMELLINMVQHSWNRYASGVSNQCVTDLMPFFNKIALTIGVELCGMTQAQVLAPGFQFDLGSAATSPFTPTNYNPMVTTINLEPLSTQGPTLNMPTIRDVQPMFVGIQAHILVNLLAQAPRGPIPSAAGVQGNPLMGRDAMLAYASTQPNALPTARDTIVNAVNAEIAAAQGTPANTTPGQTGGTTAAAAGTIPVPAAGAN
jgi:hypothetical protein